MGSERRDRVVRGLQMGEILRGGWCPGRAGGRSAGSGLGRPCEVLGGVLKVSKEGGRGSRARGALPGRGGWKWEAPERVGGRALRSREASEREWVEVRPKADNQDPCWECRGFPARLPGRGSPTPGLAWPRRAAARSHLPVKGPGRPGPRRLPTCAESAAIAVPSLAVPLAPQLPAPKLWPSSLSRPPGPLPRPARRCHFTR